MLATETINDSYLHWKLEVTSQEGIPAYQSDNPNLLRFLPSDTYKLSARIPYHTAPFEEFSPMKYG